MSVEQAVTPEVVESEAENSGPPIEVYCKECGAFIPGEPVREGSWWILGPCMKKGKGRKPCSSYNVYLPDVRRTTTKGHLWVQEEKKKLEEKRALAPYLEGREYHRDTFIDETRFYLSQSIQGAIEAGRRLIVLRHKEGREGFPKLVENEVGIPTTTSYRMMKLAERVQSFPTSGMMKKLHSAYELIELSDDDLRELEETGLLDGKSKDELDKMTIKELREFCRKQKGQLAKGEDQLKKARKDLEAERKAKSPELTDLDRLCAQALKTLGALSLLEIPEEDREAASGYYASLADSLNVVRVNLLDTGVAE